MGRHLNSDFEHSAHRGDKSQNLSENFYRKDYRFTILLPKHTVQNLEKMDFESCGYESCLGGTGAMPLDQGYQYFSI